VDKAAKYYKKEAINKCRCILCPHRCFLPNNKTGLCKVRYNKDGVVYTKVYGELTSYAMDPIEKKPLYHFYPGVEIFSIGTWGCSFRCTNCQNWTISQQQVPTEHFESESIVDIALNEKAVGIAYTYNEPTIWFEYVYDTAKLAREKGLKNVMVTNGFINEEPLNELLTVVDAFNIDLKASNEAFYREVCFGQLPPVMRSIKQVYEAGAHVELTNLVIPTLNDREDEIGEIVDWVASISDEIPLHFSRYFPQYKMDIDPTPVETLMRAYETAKKKLKYVYVGNVPSSIGGSDTSCPKCGKEVIKRAFPAIDASGVTQGCCKFCGEKIYGRFL
jgi:pyruvate formate lyase activating enzyme